MIDQSSTPNGVIDTVNTQLRIRDAVYSIKDICGILGCCPVTASKFMKESGRCLRVHGRMYILESSFYRCLHELEGCE